MCWNAEVSLNTFLLACFATALGLANGVMTPWVAIFLMTYSCMQLLEHFLWKHISNAKLNRMLSMIGLALLMTEVFISILSLSEDHKLASAQKWLMIGLGLYLCGIAYYVFTGAVDFRTTVATNGHLHWHWVTTSPAALAAWLALFLIPLWLKAQYLYLTFCMITVLVSVATFWSAGTWGSMWCWFAGGASLYYIAAALLKAGGCVRTT